MKKYLTNYLRHHHLTTADVLCCKVCGQAAVDIHHITFRSRGGSDNVDNLIALCRPCHEYAHANNTEAFRDYLRNLINEEI